MTTTPTAAHVTNIPTPNISPNPHNPRRLFDDEPMKILQDSIQKLGILVPLTIYQEAGPIRTATTPYVLLDGERRWRCANELKLTQVPAIIVQQPSDIQNVLTMFHIHNVRESWQLMPTALKLQTLMRDLGVTSERDLSELTKLTIAQIRRCKILLTYPREIQNLMLAPPSDRMKADFFIEMERLRGPARRHEFPPWHSRGDLCCIQILLDKYERGIIRAVTEFRHLAELYRGSIRISRVDTFMSELDHFLQTPNAAVDDVQVPGATFEKEARELRRSASRLITQLEATVLEDVSSDEDLVQLLIKLQDILMSNLDRTFLVGVRDVASHHD